MASLALGRMIQSQNMNNLGAEKQLPSSLDKGAKAQTPPGPEWQCRGAAVCATVQFNTVCALLFNHTETGTKSGGFYAEFPMLIHNIFHVNVCFYGSVSPNDSLHVHFHAECELHNDNRGVNVFSRA